MRKGEKFSKFKLHVKFDAERVDWRGNTAAQAQSAIINRFKGTSDPIQTRNLRLKILWSLGIFFLRVCVSVLKILGVDL
jgi:hypothetical protein